ncbi:MAG: M2 family metallopeptidase [Anaerolineae bacterium]|nr:M2 family metallopeptidase [Anaerolineae bacterium]MDW8071743.1 M2 family metallopeptidase [Anaerolineae bacterium]
MNYNALAEFVEQFVAQVEKVETQAALAYWYFTTTGRPEHQQEYVRLQIALRRLYADRATFERFNALCAEHPPAEAVLARQVVLLRYQFLGNQMDDETIRDISQREADIENEFNTFRAVLNGKTVSDNELKEILRESTDNVLRQRAWEASKQIGARVAPRLLELVEIRNRVARDIGFDNYYTMRLTLQELDEAQLFTLWDELDRQVRPIYQAYKASLDARLSARFGVAPQALRPWHYSDPFFQEAPMADPAVHQFLTNTYVDQDLVALGRRFYHALGLQVDDILARSDLYERANKQQHAYCIHIDRKGDVRMLCNLRPNYQWMSTLLHELGHAVYDKYLDMRLPYVLRQPAHTLMTEAVAILMGRLASDVDWISTYIPERTDEARQLECAMRQYAAAELLIMSRWVPVMSHFERALYRDPSQDLNHLWWDLVEHFQGVARPDGRDAPDWAAKIHLSTAPVYYHNYLLGEMIASQLRAAIEREVLKGEERAGQRFVSDPAVGSYLRERVFQPGALRHWQDALAYATGEHLQPHYFVQDVGAAHAEQH